MCFSSLRNAYALIPVIIVILVHPVFSETDWDAGIDLYSAYDTNPQMEPEWSARVQDAIVLGLLPWGNLKWKEGFNEIRSTGRYLFENYQQTEGMPDRSQFRLNSQYFFHHNATISTTIQDNLIQSGFGPEYTDYPEYTGKTFINEIRPGIEMRLSDYYEASASFLWRLKNFSDIESVESIDHVFTEDWDDMGMEFSGRYICIPQLQFLASLKLNMRKFDNYEPMPGHKRSDAMFGFLAKLPGGSEISVHGHLFTVEFKGDVPRRMNSNYTNYGMSFRSSHPITSDWLLTLSAKSIFEISERGPRMFYHDRGFSASITYNDGGPIGIGADYRFDKLEYDGQEPEFYTRTSNAGITMTYNATNWMSLAVRYAFFQHDFELSEDDVTSQRIGLTVTFKRPTP